MLLYKDFDNTISMCHQGPALALPVTPGALLLSLGKKNQPKLNQN